MHWVGPKILRYLESNPGATGRDIKAHVGANRTMRQVTDVLSNLRISGRIENLGGRGRGAQWFIAGSPAAEETKERQMEIRPIVLREELMDSYRGIQTQIDGIRKLTEEMGIEAHELKDMDGNFPMIPLLVARVQVLHALTLLNQKGN